MDRYFIEMSLANDSLISADNASLRLFAGALLDQYGFFQRNKYNQFLKTISDISAYPGMILVAEAGMGKSYVMDKLKSEFPAESTFAISLSMYQGDASGLVADISHISDTILHVFIDGIDEATELIPPMLRALSMLTTTSIYIASRNISQLKTIQSQLSLSVYYLLPLTKENVLQIAEEQKIDGSDFIEKVIYAGISPICAKPLGCKLLITAYQKDELKNTSSDFLWEQSILALCAENDSPTRRLTSGSPIGMNTCFDYAAKIALILKLSGKSTIKNILPFSVDNKNIDFSLFDNEFDAKHFSQILLRGLFLPIGADCFRFAHISYFDYLAAIGLLKYVDRRHWGNILLSPDRSAIYPQWEGVAAWIASFDQEWGNIILTIQAELLLVSDEIIHAIGVEKLCSALIDRAAELDFWRINDPLLQGKLSKLKSPQIVPILKNTFADEYLVSQKEIALGIIKECSLHELEYILVSLFNNSKEILSLRKKAGYALSEFSSPSSREKCKAILSDESCPLELKGILFRMTWPDLISFREISPHLVSKDRHIIDAYDMWLTYEFPHSLTDLSEQQSIDLLRWAIEDIIENDDYRDPILNLKRQIFTMCWKKYDHPKFYEFLAQGFLAFKQKHIYPFADEAICGTPKEICYSQENFLSDKEKRYRFANFLVELSYICGDELTVYSTPVLYINDLDFILKRIEEEPQPSLQRKWVSCLRNLQYGIPLPKLSECWNMIHERFPDIFTDDACTAIKKREAQNLQETMSELALKKRMEEKENRRRLLRNKNISAIKEALANGTASKSFYSIINFFLSETDMDAIDYRDREIFAEFTPCEISKLAIAARDFLFELEIPSETHGNPAYPRAFYLLFTENQEEFKRLPEDIWKKFSLELLSYSIFDKNNILLPVFEHMASSFPETFKTAIVEVIKLNMEQGCCFNNENIKVFLTKDICLAVMELCDAFEMNDAKKFLILNEIKKIFPSLVSDFLVKKVLSTNIAIEDYGARVSLLIFDFFPDKIGDIIRLIEQNPSWGKKWLEDVIGLDRYEHPLLPTFSNASLDVLSDFYIWLHNNYPSKDKPQHEGVYSPSNLDNIYELIGKIFNTIIEYSSVGVVFVLKKINEQFPQDLWMKDYIIRAKSYELKILNPVYSVDEIKKIIVNNSQGELINSPEGLLNLVLDCLKKYQTYLTGKENPRIEDLWNINGTSLAHKPEEAFSDHIKSFLDLTMKSSGMIINREVQLNRGINGESGSRTDLWLNVYSHDHRSKYSLCIEVKGSWNPSAPSALKEQLCDKYMGAGGADAGIYLLGWFDSKEYPQSKNMWNNERENAIKDLSGQANQCKQNGILIDSIVINCDYRI